MHRFKCDFLIGCMHPLVDLHCCKQTWRNLENAVSSFESQKKNVISVKSSCSFYFVEQKWGPPITLTHAHTLKARPLEPFTWVRWRANLQDSSSICYVSFNTGNSTQSTTVCFVKIYTHAYTRTHTYSMHHFRSLYCIINNKGNENIAMIFLQQWRSEALRAEKMFSGEFGIW